MKRIAIGSTIVMGLALILGACSSGMSQDEVDAAIQQAVAEATNTTETPSPTVPPTSSTSSTTTTPVETTPPTGAEAAFAYFRAIYLGDFAEASQQSVDDARDYSQFLADLQEVRPLTYVPGLSLGVERDVLLQGDEVQYCTPTGGIFGGADCIIASDFEFDDRDRLSSYSMDGDPIGTLVIGPVKFVEVEYVYRGEASPSLPSEPGVAYGNPDRDGGGVEFVVRPKWIASTPLQTTVVMELSTKESDLTRASQAWPISEGDVDYANNASSLIPLGFQTNRLVATPFAFVSQQSPVQYNVGPTTTDGTLFEFTYPAGMPIRSLDLSLTPFPDLRIQEYRIVVDSGAVTISNGSGDQDEDELIETSLAECGLIDADQLAKNPGAYRGSCIEAYGVVFQYDTNTGPCTFLADVGDRKSTRAYEYDDTVWFGFGPSPEDYSLVRQCPVLDGVDENDFIQIWAVGTGTFSYTSSTGASITVPAMSIVRVEVYKKN